MEKIKHTALIVDDEKLARDDLKNLLVVFPDIQVIGEAENVKLAKFLIEQYHPDIIFLDVKMQNETGFDVINGLKTDAQIIFVTAYNEYAIQAFEVNAVDYLLKPVDRRRLTQTLERINLNSAQGEIPSGKFKPDDNIFIHLDDKYYFIKIRSIIKVSAADDYSEIITNDGRKGLTSKTMREWEARLPENMFSRIHRSTIINMEEVVNIEQWFNHSLKVYLKGIPKPVVMSRRYVSKLKNNTR